MPSCIEYEVVLGRTSRTEKIRTRRSSFKLFLPFLSKTRARSLFGLGVRLRIGELSRDRTVLFFKSDGIRPTDDRRPFGLGGRSSGPINGESFRFLSVNCGDGDRIENGESQPLEGDSGVGDRQTNGA